MKNLFTILMISIAVNAFSQNNSKNFKLTKSIEFSEKKSSFSRVIGGENEHVFIVRYADGLVIEKIDHNGQVLKTLSMGGLKFENKLDKVFAGGIVFNHRLFVRFKVYDRAKKVTHMILDEYDINDLTFVNTILDETTANEGKKEDPQYGFAVFSSYDEADENGLKISPDGRFLMTLSSSHFTNKDATEDVFISVFDEAMGAVWSEKFDLPHKATKWQLNDWFVDNTGAVHVVCVNSDLKDFTEGRRKMALLSFSNEGSANQERDLDLDCYLGQWTASLVNNNELMLAGFLVPTDNEESLELFSVKVDLTTNETPIRLTYPISNEFILSEGDLLRKGDITKGAVVEKSTGLSNYNIFPVQFFDDGSYTVLFEYNDSFLSGSSSSSQTIYERGQDVLAYHFDSTGKALWQSKVERVYSDIDSHCTSLLVNRCNDEIVVIYNNVVKQDADRRILLSAAIIRKDGETSVEELLTISPEDLKRMNSYFARNIRDCESMLILQGRRVYHIAFLEKTK